jgi:2-phospho-L-lactate/phosphoenolpyruvate guanylyltransferase
MQFSDFPGNRTIFLGNNRAQFEKRRCVAWGGCKVVLYAVVPVKNLGVSKRRLSEVFTPHERRTLTLAMLEDVLIALKESAVNKIVVIGEDLQVQEVAEKLDAYYLSATNDGLNPAIQEATGWCMQQGASSVLVLPADIPLLTAKDVDRIIALGVGKCAVVLSPSGNWGTNALYQCPPKLIPACFGPKSFIEHIREAYTRGISVRLHFSTGLATDIDSAEDLRKIFQIENATVCRRTLKEITANSQKAREFFAEKS